MKAGQMATPLVREPDMDGGGKRRVALLGDTFSPAMEGDDHARPGLYRWWGLCGEWCTDYRRQCHHRQRCLRLRWGQR